MILSSTALFESTTVSHGCAAADQKLSTISKSNMAVPYQNLHEYKKTIQNEHD